MSHSPTRYSGSFGTIATFRYAGGVERSLVAQSRVAAFAQARRRWGGDWIGEPCFSTPNSIYNDVTGMTRERRGSDLTMRDRTREQQRRLRREGRS